MMFMAKSRHRLEHLVKSENATITPGREREFGNATLDTPQRRGLGLFAIFAVLAFLAMPMMIWLYFI